MITSQAISETKTRGDMNPYLVNNLSIAKQRQIKYLGLAQNEIVWYIYPCSSVGSVQELKAKGPGFESSSNHFVFFYSFFFCLSCDNKT